ncbi:MAG: SRPBCC domain-containing protein [Phycisphaerales bacterium]|nr:SRPBCC domain-containing protein [Phycisphaerales bacterium]
MPRTMCILACLALSPLALAEKVLRWEVVVDAPVADVWRAFTVEEQVEKWMVPNSQIDLRIGGAMLNNYSVEGPLTPETPGTIIHTYLAIEPERMIASRVTVPEGAPVPKCIEESWGVTRFEPLPGNRTRITLSSCGWGEGPDWDAAEEFFRSGNQWTLDRLRELFPSPSREENDRAFDLLRRLVGGEWIVENIRPDGSVFRVRNLMTFGATENVILTAGWLGDAEGMFHHGAGQIWREPVTGRVVYQSINEADSIASGAITLESHDTILWDWTVTRPSGEVDVYRVIMEFLDADRYAMSIDYRNPQTPDAAWTPMISAMEFKRVERAPEPFHRLKPGAPRR